MILYTRISYVNERAKMKKSRQNDGEIRVQDDNIKQNTNAKSPLAFKNLLYVAAYMQSKRHKES